MDLDTLYYFKYENDNIEKKGAIPLVKCNEIIIKDMSKSKDKGFTFKLNVGDRIYHLKADTENERKN